jgi:hypothetical protein
MIAGRRLNDLRHSGDILQSRHVRNGRLAMIAVAVLVLPIVGLTRSFGKPESSAPVRPTPKHRALSARSYTA